MGAENKVQSKELQSLRIYRYGNKFKYVSQVGSESFM